LAFEAALVLVTHGFQDPAHLAGASPSELPKLVESPKGKALLPAEKPACQFHNILVAIPALQLEEKLTSAQLESSLPSQRLLQIAVANLKLHTRKESLKSVASGLRLRHAFASTVLGYAEDSSLLPHVEGDMCRFIAIFQNPGTATNYVGYIKWACQGFALLLDWHGSDLKMTLQGLKKQYQSASLPELGFFRVRD
jgi:hypothetical protein